MDRRAELEANLKYITDALDDAELNGSEVATLCRERRITLSELDGLTAKTSGTITDQVKEKREKRRTDLLRKAAKSS